MESSNDSQDEEGYALGKMFDIMLLGVTLLLRTMSHWGCQAEPVVLLTGVILGFGTDLVQSLLLC